jgi:integrase
VGHAQKTPLRGLRFETIEEAQAYLDRWEARWADTRIHPTTKRQVAAMFAEEQPALGPLPLEPLDLGVPTYRFLRRYLERRLPAPLTLRQVDPLIRQLTLYRDLIDRKTGDPL